MASLINVEVSNLATPVLSVGISDYIDFATRTFVTQSISSHNISLISHEDIRTFISTLSSDVNTLYLSAGEIIIDYTALFNQVSNSLSGYAPLSGANFFGNISATNLTGTNTGDQDLSNLATYSSVTSSISEHNIAADSHQDIRDLIARDNNVLSAYAPLSGANFFGNISAPNLTGTNTGDQDLSPYALGADLNNLSNSLSSYALQTFVTSSISEHNVDDNSHTDIRNLANSAWQNPPEAVHWGWTKDTTSVTLTSYDFYSLDVVIPDMLDGLPVTVITPIFPATYITSIRGNNITTIREAAFSFADRLTSVSFPQLTTVERESFAGCVVLTSVTFSQNAPTSAAGVYSGIPANQVTNYVTNPTATGWGATFGDMPVVRLPVFADSVTTPTLSSLNIYNTSTITTSSMSAIGNIYASNVEYIANKTNDLSANISTVLYPTTSAVKTYVDIKHLELSGNLTSSITNLNNSLSAYSTKTFTTSSISEHNISSSAHSGIRNDITTLSNNLTANYVPYIDANQGLNLGSYDLSAANLEDYKQYSGFENRTDSSISIDGSGIFTLSGTSFNVYTYITGKHTLTGTQTATITADQTLTYVYVDDTGTLRSDLSMWNLNSGDNAPCSIIFKDGTSYAITDERHSFERNKAWHYWAHSNIGAMYRSGFTGTFTTTTISVTQGVVSDEDISYDSLETKTSTTLWYRNGANGMRMIRNSAVARGTVGGILAYDDGSGTLAEVDNNKYVTNWVYATNDPTQPIYTVIGQNNSNTITLARNALSPTINLSTAEWKLIYRVIYQRTAGTPAGVFTEATDFRRVQTGTPTAAVSTDHASLINRDAPSSHPATAISYDNTLTSAYLSASNTQNAIDEIALEYATNTSVTNLSNSLSSYAFNTTVTAAITAHNVAPSSHQDIRNSIPSITGLATETFVTSSIAAIPPVDLSLYATLSGSTFLGSITATNLSGTNTGDQDLSSYATTSYVTSALAGLGWLNLVSSWTIEPSGLIYSGGDGEVYQYTYGTTIYYRYVPTIYDSTLDAFYTNFIDPTLSGLITTRG